MNSPTEAIAFDVLEQAAEWFATLRAEDATPEQTQRWQAWLAASEAHRKAWQRVEAVGRQFDNVNAEKEQASALHALDAAAKGRQQRRRSLKMLVLLCATGAVAWGGSRSSLVQQSWLASVADYATGIGEMRQVTLADGSSVWLNTASALDAQFDSQLRRLHLRSGEILVETARDTMQPPRPLVVDTAQGRLRAIGTRFSVRQTEGLTTLAVFEGAVEVAPADTQQRLIVEAGQQVAFDNDRIDTPQPADTARQAWSNGVLFADHMRLDDFVAELARYRRGHLGCAPDVAELRVSGAFPLRDMDKTFAMLAAALPVEVKSTLPWWSTVQARREE